MVVATGGMVKERERESIRVVLLVGRDCLRGIDVENNGWTTTMDGVCVRKKRGEEEKRKKRKKKGGGGGKEKKRKREKRK